ncbi:MAG: copper chaperone [Chloroflexi bacterium]|nr:copper chaperone [Chloroflexota bacterium]
MSKAGGSTCEEGHPDRPQHYCEDCERTVKTALGPLAGVQSVRVDIRHKLVHLEFDESALDFDNLKVVLAGEDYPVATVTQV